MVKLRKKIRVAAIVALLAYSIVRSLVVDTTLSTYGVNPWVFFALDAGTTVTYVIGIEMLIVSLLRKGNYPLVKTVGWAALAAISFSIPYLYLFWAGKELPASLLWVIGLIVLLLLAGAVLSVVRRVRHKKK